MSTTTLPISEVFYSLQGEALLAGVPMLFVRLAGCNVGRPASEHFQVVNQHHTVCTSHSGQQFECDTDYRRKMDWTVAQLLDEIKRSGAKWVSITGGEPLIHGKKLVELINALYLEGVLINIETSGTLPLDDVSWKAWITCSPKIGFLHSNASQVNQYKFLVSCSDDVAAAEEFLEKHGTKDALVYVQPIHPAGGQGRYSEVLEGQSTSVSQAAVMAHPTWRLSLQLHQLLGVR